MSLASAEPAVVRGSQEPSFLWLPPDVGPSAWFEGGELRLDSSSTGADAIELSEMAGLYLDPWQQFVLANALTERADGAWAALRVGLMVSRQNGKDAIIEGRELASLFLLGERLVTHSAHRWDTTLEHLNRLVERIESTPDLDAQVAKVNRAHGEEGITLRSGARIQFRTRTKIGGVGFSADLLFFNEAMDIPEAAHGSLVPTLSARPNVQIWYAGSAVDQEVMEHGVVFARLRRLAMRAASDPEQAERARRTMYAEWAADEAAYEADPKIADDPEQWARANPGLGIRITTDFIETVEREGLDEKRFLAQRLGLGDWPDPDGEERVISEAKWDRCFDEDPEDLRAPVAFAVDVSPDRARAAIAVAGRRPDGPIRAEIIEAKRGTAWILDTLVALQAKNPRSVIVLDGTGPVGSLIDKMEEQKLRIRPITAREHAQACGNFYDDVDEGTFRHLSDPRLNIAVAGAVKRPLGEAWAWSRRNSAVDISPLVAATLAHWGAQQRRPAPTVVDLSAFEDGAEEGRAEELLPADDDDFLLD